MFDRLYTPEEIVKMNAEFQIHKAVNRYGLEGTEEKIKELYKHATGLQKYLLDVLYDFWRKKI